MKQFTFSSLILSGLYCGFRIVKIIHSGAVQVKKYCTFVNQITLDVRYFLASSVHSLRIVNFIDFKAGMTGRKCAICNPNFNLCQIQLEFNWLANLSILSILNDFEVGDGPKFYDQFGSCLASHLEPFN